MYIESLQPHAMGVVNNFIPGARNGRTIQSGSLKKQEVPAFDVQHQADCHLPLC